MKASVDSLYLNYLNQTLINLMPIGIATYVSYTYETGGATSTLLIAHITSKLD